MSEEKEQPWDVGLSLDDAEGLLVDTASWLVGWYLTLGINLFFCVRRFQGAPYRSTCLLQPTSSALCNVTEWVSVTG